MRKNHNSCVQPLSALAGIKATGMESGQSESVLNSLPGKNMDVFRTHRKCQGVPRFDFAGETSSGHKMSAEPLTATLKLDRAQDTIGEHRADSGGADAPLLLRARLKFEVLRSETNPNGLSGWIIVMGGEPESGSSLGPTAGGHLGGQQVAHPNPPSDRRRSGLIQDSIARRVLDQTPGFEDGDLITQYGGASDVVGHESDGHACSGDNLDQVLREGFLGFEVEIIEWLV